MRRLVLPMLMVLAGCARRGHESAPRPTGPPPSALADPVAMRVHVIDVGQGAATLLEFPCAAILVDTGGEDVPGFSGTESLMAYLAGFFASRPDLHGTLAALYLTHPHLDHTRGAQAVFETYTVERVITDGLLVSSGAEQQRWIEEHAAAAGVPVFKARVEDIPAGDLTNELIDPVKCRDVDPQLRVLWGAAGHGITSTWDPEAAADANNHSVVLRVDVGDASVLLLGDIEHEAIVGLMALHDTSGAIDADVVQVAHHGSHHSTTPELIAAMSPRVALIGAGDPAREAEYTAWNWGHPRQIVVRALVDGVSGVRPPREVPVALGMKRFTQLHLRRAIYSTGWDGHVVVELRGDARPKVWTTR